MALFQINKITSVGIIVFHTLINQFVLYTLLYVSGS